MGTPSGRAVIAAAVLGSGMTWLDGSVVNVALRTIGEDLDASLAQLQWINNGYLVSLASLILLGGSLGDRLGRRRIFLVGTVWFALVGPSMGMSPRPQYTELKHFEGDRDSIREQAIEHALQMCLRVQ